ncbi:MAG: hypothetical protein HFE75_07435 [Firmicutes bacterium]|nr:hypothetical protein [Bacillota bacterium]
MAKKKGMAIITVKVRGSKTLRCKVTVKVSRKSVTKKPITNPEPNPPVETECQHTWVEKERVVGYAYACNCGRIFETREEWTVHNDEVVENGGTRHSFGPYPETETYYECSKCHKTKIRNKDLLLRSGRFLFCFLTGIMPP